MESKHDIHQLLQQYWGFDTFRLLQEDIVHSVIEGHNTLVLLPTGGGKSLCYQLPAIALPGKTLVISPLIALMEDQVSGLTAKGIRAGALHSGLRKREVDVMIDNWVHGPMKILFIAPERIHSPIFWERLKRVDLSLVAIDEAHCISQWGYDFRPSYFNIKDIKQLHPKVPIVALTATATPVVANDILEKLHIPKSRFYSRSFRRENISITVMNREDKEAHLLQIISKLKGTGIIYQRNRAQTQYIAELLAAEGYRVTYYHGGLTYDTRERRQAAWMNGDIQIMVCTNAFGMGIDKPDVRYVIHLDIPPSIEEYYQEIGRAGRDGKKSYVIAILNQSDYAKALYNYDTSFPTLDEVAILYQKLHNYYKIPVGSGELESHPFDFNTFITKFGMPARIAWNILSLLDKEGWIQLSDAVKTPSKLKLQISGSQVNELLRDQGEKLRIVHQVLRMYEGLFVEPTIISESDLAKSLSTSEIIVKGQLKSLHRDGILLYQPASEDPIITFLHNRLAKNNFTIDKASYKLRQERANDRLSQVIALFKSKGCRQAFILAYFGEKSMDCGFCDNCLGSVTEAFSEKDIRALSSHLSAYLVDNQKITIAKYINLWPYNKRARIQSAIHQLANEGKLVLSDNYIVSLDDI